MRVVVKAVGVTLSCNLCLALHHLWQDWSSHATLVPSKSDGACASLLHSARGSKRVKCCRNKSQYCLDRLTMYDEAPAVLHEEHGVCQCADDGGEDDAQQAHHDRPQANIQFNWSMAYVILA